jgi:hypothetical protein
MQLIKIRPTLAEWYAPEMIGAFFHVKCMENSTSTIHLRFEFPENGDVILGKAYNEPIAFGFQMVPEFCYIVQLIDSDFNQPRKLIFKTIWNTTLKVWCHNDET